MAENIDYGEEDFTPLMGEDRYKPDTSKESFEQAGFRESTVEELNSDDIFTSFDDSVFEASDSDMDDDFED